MSKIIEQVRHELISLSVAQDRQARILSLIRKLEGETFPITAELYWPVEVYATNTMRWIHLYHRDPFFLRDGRVIDKFFKLALPWIVSCSDPLEDYAVVSHVRKEATSVPAVEGSKTVINKPDVNVYDGRRLIRILLNLTRSEDNICELSDPIVSDEIGSLPGDSLVGSVDHRLRPDAETLARLLARWLGRPFAIEEAERKEDDLTRQLSLLMQGAFDELHTDGTRVGLTSVSEASSWRSIS